MNIFILIPIAFIIITIIQFKLKIQFKRKSGDWGIGGFLISILIKELIDGDLDMQVVFLILFVLALFICMLLFVLFLTFCSIALDPRCYKYLFKQIKQNVKNTLKKYREDFKTIKNYIRDYIGR